MSPRAARTLAEPGGRQKGRKSTQRERLLAGMVVTGNRDGYGGVNVSKIIAEAGVSRPTFYDYFADKDDCFLATIADIQQQLLEEVQRAVAEHAPERALAAGLGALVKFANAEPARALLVTSQSMAAGPRSLDKRDEGIAEVEWVIEEAERRAGADELIPDVCPRMVIGGTYRVLASRLRRGEPALARVSDALQRWIDSYRVPVSQHRWRPLRARTLGALGASPVQAPLPAPRPLPPGRPGVSKEEVAANHRQRIMYAAAQLAEQKGYNATTIADITKAAGVDGRAFYAAFGDKQDAFMAVHELGVQQVMSAMAGAFFTGESWPERVWEAVLSMTRFLEADPLITHVGFVEAHAVGPGAVQRIEDSHITFTVFLHEGYKQTPLRTPPSRLALEAIITTIFEIVYQRARKPGQPKLSGLSGHMVFLCLAPFLGADEANRFIERKLSP